MKKIGKKSLLAIVAIVVGIISLIASGEKPSNNLTNEPTKRQVELASVFLLSTERNPLPVIGVVESKSEAKIHSETQGEITRVYKNLGDRVNAGEVLAEISNSLERAALLQAEGLVDAARASFEKVTGGARTEEKSILEINVKNSEKLLVEAKISAINSIKNSFASADDAIRNRIDPMFTNGKESNPQINFPVKDAQLEIDLENERFFIEEALKSWINNISELNPDNLSPASFALAEDNTNRIRDFLNNLALAINALDPSLTTPQSTIDAWKANILASRNSITASLSSLSGAKDNLSNKESGLAVAKQQLEIGVTGGSTEDVNSVLAAVKQAEGALQAARANLEKTIIRTPIAGEINALNIKQGDFVSMFELLAIVSNNNALEITTFITDKDRDQISIGSGVLIDGRWQGVITNIAPALSDSTKKLEVKVGIQAQDTTLVNGQTVTLEIERSGSSKTTEEVTVPVSALKVGFDSNIIFTIDNQNKLVPHEVVIGSLIGEKVIIKSGITNDMNIVLDARGLQAGQVVTTK